MDTNKCSAGIRWLRKMQFEHGNDVSAIVNLAWVLNQAGRIQRLRKLGDVPQPIMDWFQKGLDRRLEDLVAFFPYDEELSRYIPVEVGKVLNTELHGRLTHDPFLIVKLAQHGRL